MKNLIFTFALSLIVSSSYAKNVLIVGDSHTVGPYGHTLFNLVQKTGNNVSVYGHSSSAPIQWMSDVSTKLTGGAYHEHASSGKNLTYKFPSDWRVPIETISFKKLLTDIRYHASWKTSVTMKPDLVIISLGANDYNAVTDTSGKINSYQYELRQKAITSMIDSVDAVGAKCVWVLPPDGIKKDSKRQAILYKFLTDAIQNRCEVFNSLKYKTTGCDGIHFSCASQEHKALSWANEVMDSLIAPQL